MLSIGISISIYPGSLKDDIQATCGHDTAVYGYLIRFTENHRQATDVLNADASLKILVKDIAHVANRTHGLYLENWTSSMDERRSI